jgi:hypothetical protein
MNSAIRCACALLAMAVIALAGCSRQTAEEKGKALATEKIDMVKGVGDALQEKGSQAAESVAHGAGNVLQGAGRGIDKAKEWKFSSSEALTKAGLSISRVQNAADKGVDAYLIAAGNTDGTLSMIARDVAKREVARVRIDLTMAANDARYETFALDSRTPVALISELSFDFQAKPPADKAKR